MPSPDLSDITVSADDRALTGDHDISRAHDTIRERVTATWTEKIEENKSQKRLNRELHDPL